MIIKTEIKASQLLLEKLDKVAESFDQVIALLGKNTTDTTEIKKILDNVLSELTALTKNNIQPMVKKTIDN